MKKSLIDWCAWRFLLWAAAWMLSASATSLAEPVRYPVIVVFDTEEGRRDPIFSTPSVYSQSENQRLGALQSILNLDAVQVLSSLAAPMACGEVTGTACAQLHITSDADFRTTIERMAADKVLVVRPTAGVWMAEQAYYARLEVMFVSSKPQLLPLRSFVVSYHDGGCDRPCVAIAHRYAAEEFRDMIAYMLNVVFDQRARKLPPSWRDLPHIKEVNRWSNRCVVADAQDRLIVEDRDRLG